MLDDRARTLINKAIDGEISDSERAEHDALLAESDEARVFSGEMAELNDFLASLPSIDPPDLLQRQILQRVQLPRPRRWFTWSAGWMQGKPISYGIAAAAGLLAAVAWYELAPGGPIPASDYSSLVGTLARGEGLRGVVQLSYLDIDLPAVRGKVLLSGSDDLKLLRFNVASQAPVEYQVSLSGSGLVFGGFAHEAEPGSDNFMYSDGKLSVVNEGAQRFTVILKDTTEAAAAGGVVVTVTQDGESLYQGVLSH